MEVKEIKLEDLDPYVFIDEKVREIISVVGENIAINAMSGGVDSSTVTMLAHRALGDKLRTYFIDTGLMREGEPENVASLFKALGVHVEIIDAKDVFFANLKGITDPEKKRNVITDAFYSKIFGKIVKDEGAHYLFHGTNFTDVEETVAGIKRQHNILKQLGIDPEKEYGYKVLEPLVRLRKTGVRQVAKTIGLPEEVYNRMPFPGPALATRIIGEVNPERVDIIRKATQIVENELQNIGAFQYLAILHEDKVTGMSNNQRAYGNQIEVRCWDSKDAVIGSPTKLSFDILDRIAERITTEIPHVVSVTYNITKKPPSTIEAV
jgi:GMP synthase (glutamine-hydrolysing)